MQIIQGNIVLISILIIVGVFIWYLFYQVKSCYIWRALKKLNSDETIDSFENSKLKSLLDKYLTTINYNINSQKKTNTPAETYFNYAEVCKSFKINIHFIQTGASTLVGLGLLGTFLGLTLGIDGFDSSSTENIKNSIQTLLGGMGTAFATSLVGMLLSLIYTIIDKYIKNKLLHSIEDIVNKLDEKYYIDDIELLKREQQSYKDELKALLTYNNENGEIVVLGNAIREMYSELKKQSQALQSFSTDLALELNNGFDEMLSRQLQAKLIPLMENIDNTTSEVVKHIDSLNSNISSPTTDILNSVVDKLQQGMGKIMEDFKNNLSGNATTQLENLATGLGEAGASINNIPVVMGEMSKELKDNFSNITKAIADISQTTETTNASTINQMNEQMSRMEEHLDSVISTISSKTTDITNNLTDSVQSSINEITSNVTEKYTNLAELQESVTTETKTLMDAFNTGLNKLEKLNEYINGTMEQFKEIQTEISGTTSNLKTTSMNLMNSSNSFNLTQKEYADTLNGINRNNKESLENMMKVLDESDKLAKEYVQKFATIQDGLSNIFRSVQSGLTEYSRTVKSSTQDYLNQYSKHITDTISSLAGTAQQFNDVIEALSETLSNKR